MITQEKLREVLDYNPETGIFRWRPGRKRSGRRAGTDTPGVYSLIWIDDKSYLAHRLAILYTDGYWPETTVDHIDRDRNNNRRANLREATRQCQCRNRSKRNDNSSGVVGVYWSKKSGKWGAQVEIYRKTNHLGFYGTILEAAYARYSAEQCLGFPDCDISSSAKQYIDAHKKPKSFLLPDKQMYCEISAGMI